MVAEEAEGGEPEDVGVEPLLSVLVLEGLLPVEEREIEDSTDRPGGQEAEEVAEVGPGLEVVELAAGVVRFFRGLRQRGVTPCPPATT
jgi:hypothetical protein